ncbi:Fic family protein [Candidatus Mycoplasma mahonii]|uniref:Fic family protein n=1 Tax=Candidatus Mycoplasma mahonii TaxID=3004105 RepID=UPI0026ED9479|nr:Fic family protein [Candidatus Mycoplasma mahonii]WKX02286.1 Fic family protein [Candidatus Mycoplasma mahonii]
MKNINLNNKVMELLIKTTDLIGKVNVLLAKMKNPYLLTYLLESTDAIASNAVEDIHTTVDEAYDDMIILEKNHLSPYVRYRETLKQAHKRLVASELIRSKDIEWINDNIRARTIGFRKTPVTIKDNKQNIVYKPPSAANVPNLVAVLTSMINDDWNQNTIVKSLLIHHEFERIHPFIDGNGRTGRILFALLLYKFKILNIPASVFSYSIWKDKKTYYKALKLADEGDFNRYLEYMLVILISSFEITIKFINEYHKKIQEVTNFEEIKNNDIFKKIVVWSFSGVKVSNKYLVNKAQQNNKTIKKYIDKLVDLGIVKIETNGRYRPYKNLVLASLVNKYFV